MADLALRATISRGQLGVPTLVLSDGLVYRCAAAPFLGEQLVWQRNQVSSAYIDGAVTVNRSRQMVNEQFAFEVSGYSAAVPSAPPSHQQFQANIATLVAAFSQDSFVLDVILGTGTDLTHYTYAGEAADVTNAMWSTPRLVAKQALLTFAVPVQPVPLAGVL